MLSVLKMGSAGATTWSPINSPNRGTWVNILADASGHVGQH
jgi:hypothetical protein